MSRSFHPLSALLGICACAGAVGLLSMRPGHGAGGAVPVQIVNSASSPVVSRDTDNPRQPYQLQTTMILNPGASSGVIEPFTVPTGKRLILECASAANSNVGDTKAYSIGVFTNGGGSTGGVHFDLVPDGAPYASVTQPIRLYGEPGTLTVVTLDRSGSTGSANVNILLSGYLVDVP